MFVYLMAISTAQCELDKMEGSQEKINDKNLSLFQFLKKHLKFSK